ncbi:MAG TPA: DegT/DnrJ/EryC1/StrS family aminotransferase [Anaeromyxobacteraceae bacterium]|nr:DegT/DnrJ/EryC1/StrS family aminotransferase [Anaeromyxobacteraceae bacterium]
MVAAVTALRQSSAPLVHRSGRRFLPVLPTLRLRMLTPRLRAEPLPFPLSDPGACSYYFARNGIWQGARMLGLAGREVLVPAYHHGVEVEALEAVGAVPRFIRVDGRMRLDLEHLEARIGPRVGALYVIHYLGFPQPMEEILAIARRHGLPVIEDCALSALSSDGNVPLGSRGDIAIFCLYKSLPVPNGGLLVLNRPARDGADSVGPTRGAPLASTLSHAAGSLLAHVALRHGESGAAMRGSLRRAGRAVRSLTGARALSTGTMHFDPSAAEIGMSRLSRLVLENLEFEAIVAARRRNFSLLLARLQGVAAPIASHLPAGVCPLFYPLLCPDKRSAAVKLAACGIETVDFWSQGHPACAAEAFPEVEALRRQVLELPLHQDLTPEDMAYLASAVEEVLS